MPLTSEKTMAKLSIQDLKLDGQRVFMRVDFNVPLDDGRVMDDTRIRETLPSIEYALRHGEKFGIWGGMSERERRRIRRQRALVRRGLASA